MKHQADIEGRRSGGSSWPIIGFASLLFFFLEGTLLVGCFFNWIRPEWLQADSLFWPMISLGVYAPVLILWLVSLALSFRYFDIKSSGQRVSLIFLVPVLNLVIPAVLGYVIMQANRVLTAGIAPDLDLFGLDGIPRLDPLFYFVFKSQIGIVFSLSFLLFRESGASSDDFSTDQR